MKTRYIFPIILILAGCSSTGIEQLNKSKVSGCTFQAYSETSSTFSRTTLDGTAILWDEKDNVSIFKGSTENTKYIVKEGYGGTSSTILEADRSQDSSNDEFTAVTEGSSISANIALYPYEVRTSCVESSGKFTLTYFTPEVQKYGGKSFGKGALPMAAVTESTDSFILNFKNLAGSIRFRFTGDVTIKSITVSGNNDEPLSGRTKAVCSFGEDPIISVDEENCGRRITLDCDDGITLKEDEPTSFAVTLPPTRFESGVRVLVATTDGILTKTTSVPLEVTRSMVRPFTLLRIGKEDVEFEAVQFDDETFKAFCVEHFDTNSDGEVSLEEASSATSMEFPSGINGLTSLRGLESFVNLKKFYLSIGTSDGPECCFDTLDFSICPFLEDLTINNAGITDLNISQNPALVKLNVNSNNLSMLDLSNCKLLESLDASSNNLTDIDLHTNAALKIINLKSNRIESIDLSALIYLKELNLQDNDLTELDISANLSLSILFLADNPLKSLYINEMQDIEGVTVNRSASNIPSSTTISIYSNIDNDIKVKPSNVNIGYGEQTFVINVTSSSSYTITVPSWIEDMNTKKTDQLTFKAAINDTYESRSGRIVFTNTSGEECYVTVTQDYGSPDHSQDGAVKLLQSATVGEGINIIFTGDGYCDIDSTSYSNYLNLAAKAFFSEEPFSTFRERFNIYSIMAISDSREIGKGTKFSTRYTGGTGIEGDYETIFDFVSSNLPEVDLKKSLITVLMNSEVYAGTCWFWGDNRAIAYVPHQTSAEEFANTLRHESCGHGFGKFGDEYVYYDTTLPESEIEEYKFWKDLSYGFMDNVDIDGSASTVKWAHFLKNRNYTGQVDIIQGAMLYAKGIYRASEYSIMRYNTGGFNAPQRESLYKRIRRLSEGSTYIYDRDEFLEYDSKNLTDSNASQMSTVGTSRFIPLHSPIFVHE